MKTNSPPSSSSLAGALLSTRPTTHPHTRKRSTQLTQQREINGRGGDSKRWATSASKNKMLWKPMYMMTNTHVGHHMVAHLSTLTHICTKGTDIIPHTHTHTRKYTHVRVGVRFSATQRRATESGGALRSADTFWGGGNSSANIVFEWPVSIAPHPTCA